MDYSELVRAIQNGDEKTVNTLCARAMPILKKYLIANFNASREDAEDAVQKMFEYLIPKIRRDGFKNPGGLLAYMLTGVRHAYYKNLRDFETEDLDELVEEPSVNPSQIWNLVSEDRLRILKICLEYLKGHYRTLVEFIFEHPDADSEDIAEHFDISLNNAWIRKHRVIKQLSDCAKENQ